MNAKISVFVICVEAIIYLLLFNLHYCTFNWNRSIELTLVSWQNIFLVSKTTFRSSRPELFCKKGVFRNLAKFQGFGREKDGNRGKIIGSNLVIFCYKEFEKFALCKSVSQSEATFIVYSEPIESGNVKINFS